MIAGIILAAGESKRMGKPKALLEYPGGRTLLSSQVDLLIETGCKPVVVVVGSDARTVIGSHPALDVSWCINENWRQGQFSSIKSGIAHVMRHDIDGAVILPVDVAGIRPSTVTVITSKAENNPQLTAIVPMFKGRGGHPIYISRAFCLEIMHIDVSEKRARLDTILKRTGLTAHIPVDDAHITMNINTPDEWRSSLGDN